MTFLWHLLIIGLGALWLGWVFNDPKSCVVVSLSLLGGYLLHFHGLCGTVTGLAAGAAAGGLLILCGHGLVALLRPVGRALSSWGEPPAQVLKPSFKAKSEPISAPEWAVNSPVGMVVAPAVGAFALFAASRLVGPTAGETTYAAAMFLAVFGGLGGLWWAAIAWTNVLSRTIAAAWARARRRP